METKLSALILLLVGLLLILAGTALVQPTEFLQDDSCTITITVQVTDDGTETGTPVTGIIVQIRTPAGETLAAGTTNDEGVVELTITRPSGTEPARYEVWVPPVAGSDPQLAAFFEELPCPEIISIIVQVSAMPIGEVQGVVSDADNGRGHRSPYKDEVVTVQGVIYQKTLARTSSGNSLYGFFIQNTEDTADGDPNTSDGLFVFLGTSPAMETAGPEEDAYLPQIGNEVVIRGAVTEYYNLTELTDVELIEVVRTGVDLNTEVSAFEVDPPANLEDAYRYWERREGMRAQIPTGSTVLNGRDVFSSTMDGEVWLARGDSEIAQRVEAYARRVFRDPHPLDNLPDELFDDGNGYRIVLGSLGIKAASEDDTALIAPARTFDILENAPIGGVYYSFGKYQIQTGEQLELTSGVDPSLNAPPPEFDRGLNYSVATYNVENLYDYRDDPFDGCDFVGNEGCEGVYPPFNYVPPNDEVYQARLGEIAQQIIEDLHAPDIILVQEAEDQDICTVDAATFTCGDTDNADGKPDTLQEVASVIVELEGPTYEAAYDRDGTDDRGIVSAFLYRTDRVELLPPLAGHPVLGSAPQVDYRGEALAYNTDTQNPKVLNAVLPEDVDRSTGVDGDNVFTRAPQVGLFRVRNNGGRSETSVIVYAVSNHFSSGPDRRVGQRIEQAAYNAAIVRALQQINPPARVVVGGDLNVYPRPDDPFPDDPSDQLAPLYQQGLMNLYAVLLDEAPASAYSYVYQGQAQTLDQLFVTSPLAGELDQVRVSHINSDWPAEYGDDGPRGASDHDPVLASFSFVWQVYLPLVTANAVFPAPSPTPTLTPTIVGTPTATDTPVSTPTPSPTVTPTATATPPATSTPTASATPTATETQIPTATSTSTRTPTSTATPTSTLTPSPTVTATSPPAVSNVQVNGFCSQFDAPGNDHDNLNGEWVCFTNQGGGPADMTNWRVEDEADHTYRFPSFTLPEGATVKLHTGSGINTSTDLYWGSGRAIWNNGGDTVYLYDSSGNLVDEYSY